jgi:uncharacterized protein YegP (UPF0339 family)
MKCIKAMLGLAPILKAELFQSSSGGHWYWRLRARNGEIVAQSEGYTRRESAEDTLRMIAKAKIEL